MSTYRKLKGRKVLRAVAEGRTLKEAGAAVGVGGNAARGMLYRICRELRLPSSLSDIRNNKEACLAALGVSEDHPVIELNSKIAYSLQEALRLKTAEEVAPKYVSNLSASQLLANGLTPTAVSDIQCWLVQHGTSLRRKAPEEGAETTLVRRAIDLLDAFHFDTKKVQEQFDHLISEE